MVPGKKAIALSVAVKGVTAIAALTSTPKKTHAEFQSSIRVHHARIRGTRWRTVRWQTR